MQRIGILFGLVALCLAGCSGWNDAQTSAVDGYAIAMKTSPAPLEVGSPAEIKVKLTQGDKSPAADCSAAFRQHMPGMEMSTDHLQVTMQSQGGGVYSGTSSDFSMGGDWQIEVKFTCGGTERTAVFDYHLEWPE